MNLFKPCFKFCIAKAKTKMLIWQAAMKLTQQYLKKQKNKWLVEYFS